MTSGRERWNWVSVIHTEGHEFKSCPEITRILDTLVKLFDFSTSKIEHFKSVDPLLLWPQKNVFYMWEVNVSEYGDFWLHSPKYKIVCMKSSKHRSLKLDCNEQSYQSKGFFHMNIINQLSSVFHMNKINQISSGGNIKFVL